MAADSKCLCPSSSMFSTTMCGAMLASVLVTSTVAIAPPPARPSLLRTFGALMRARSWAPGAQNLSVVGNVAVSESASALYQESHLLDGRTAAQVSKCGPAQQRYTTAIARPSERSIRLQFVSHRCSAQPFLHERASGMHRTTARKLVATTLCSHSSTRRCAISTR